MKYRIGFADDIKKLEFAMIKLKFLFAFFFILAIWQVFPSRQGQGKKVAIATKIELQSKFEESQNQSLNFGDVPTGDTVISVFSTSNVSFFSNLKVNNFLSAFNVLFTNNSYYLAQNFDISSKCYRADVIPIYLQTGNFLL